MRHTVYDGEFFIVMNGEVPFYEIEKYRCKTKEDILHWVTHFSLKNWVTREIVRDFIRVTSEVNNINYY